tara:strand:- start:1279 stop:1602 length:324 start_codon:yes stop_codon:yes gene_type:complete
VLVKPGQKVEEGDTLAVLEALKQENRLVASHAGFIGQLLANPGDSLKRNQALLQLQRRDFSTFPTRKMPSPIIPAQVSPRIAPSNIMGQNVARFAQTVSKFLKFVPK